LQEIDHRARQSPLRRQFLPQLVEFALLGQPSVPKQEDHFLEIGMIGERVDVIAAIAQYAGVAVDVTNLALARNHAFQTCRRCSHSASCRFLPKSTVSRTPLPHERLRVMRASPKPA